MCGIAYRVDTKEIWLEYFNKTLYDKGIITKSERDKMAQLIRKKCHTPSRGDKIKTLKETS